jgi:hypothetical protein
LALIAPVLAHDGDRDHDRDHDRDRDCPKKCELSISITSSALLKSICATEQATWIHTYAFFSSRILFMLIDLLAL